MISAKIERDQRREMGGGIAVVLKLQEQLSGGVVWKKCSENMQ